MDTDAFSQPLTTFYDRLRTLSQTLEQRATSLELPLDKLMEDLSTALDGILLADNTAGYVDANPAACMLTGYDRAVLLQRSVWDLTPETDQERTAALAAANAALRQEMAERQHAEEERRRLEREAQRAQHFALLGRLAAGVSHEIRNPLAAVFLHVDLLEEEFRQPSSDSAVQIAESLTDIKRNLVRLEDLVQDYLSLVRVATIQRTPEDLGALVLMFAHEMDTVLATRSITLQLDGLAHLGCFVRHAVQVIEAVRAGCVPRLLVSPLR